LCFDSVAARIVDEVVRLIPADMRREPHHHRLGDDESVGQAKVLRHAGQHRQ